MKKGKLTEVELACLKGMAIADFSVNEMAKQLDRSVNSVQKELDRINEQNLRDKMFITRTAGGDRGVTIMTEAASVRADENSNQPPTTIPRQTDRSEWIHTIRPDEK
jgi:hypothetical protein